MHQIVPYLTSVCKTHEGSRILLVDDLQSSLREPKHDVKIVKHPKKLTCTCCARH